MASSTFNKRDLRKFSRVYPYTNARVEKSIVKSSDGVSFDPGFTYETAIIDFSDSNEETYTFTKTYSSNPVPVVTSIDTGDRKSSVNVYFTLLSTTSVRITTSAKITGKVHIQVVENLSTPASNTLDTDPTTFKFFDENRFRKNYTIAQKKRDPSLEINLDPTFSKITVQTNFVSFSNHTSRTFTLNAAFTGTPTILITPGWPNLTYDTDVNVHVSSIVGSTVTIDASESFVGRVFYQAWEIV